jgi:hypothetical protein
VLATIQIWAEAVWGTPVTCASRPALKMVKGRSCTSVV